MKEFKCGKCSAIFYTRDDLRRHIFSEHLYPESKALGEINVNDDAHVDGIENVIKANLADLLSGENIDADFSELANDAAKKGYVKTHKILKNKNKRCALLDVNQHEPPGWKCVFSGTYDRCKAYMRSVCGSQNKC